MEDRTICHCFDVTLADIKQAVENGCNTIEQLQDETGLGNACGACLDETEELLNELID